MKYGYVRVSADGQSVTAQVAQLRADGCSHFFRQVASGAKSERPALTRVLDQLAADGVLVVTRLDHSTHDLVDTMAPLLTARPASVPCATPGPDTTTPHGRLMLAVLGWLDEFERELIRTRTSESRARAVARGVKLGPKPKLTPHQQKEAIKHRKLGDETLQEIGRRYNVRQSTISRLAA
jgi:DNA invertase Pin-like site-specific DNA recombinase